MPFIAALVVVSLFSVRSYYRNFAWKDDITLFTAGVQESPLSFRCYQSLAFAYLEQLGNVPPEEQRPPVSLRFPKPASTFSVTKFSVSRDGNGL